MSLLNRYCVRISHSSNINNQSRSNSQARTPQISYKYHILLKNVIQQDTEVLRDVLQHNLIWEKRPLGTMKAKDILKPQSCPNS